MERNELIKKFYSKKFFFSYSGLNKLLYSPGLFFRHYILQEKDDRLESYLLEGKVIHCLLLEDEVFNQKFIIMLGNLPTANTKSVVDRVFEEYKLNPQPNLQDYNTTITAILKEMNLHQSLKTDGQRIEKIITEDSKNYWEFLKTKENKELVSKETYDSCVEAVDALKSNSQVCQLLGLTRDLTDPIDVYNETYIEVDTDKAFGIKGFTDNIQVDHRTKRIYLNDIKKTSKTLDDFEETIQFYNYWCQMAIYYRLVHAKFYELVSTGYTVECRFIVIDKYLQVYPFEVSLETMSIWQKLLEEKLNEADWHYTNRKYNLPYKFETGKVIL